MAPGSAVLPQEPQPIHTPDAKAPLHVVSVPTQDASVPKACLMDMSSFIIPETPPDLNIPDSQATVKVSIIDTTSYMSNFAMSAFLDPLMPGHEEMKGCDFSFIIEHPKSGNKYDTLLFDLGVRKDWENLPTAFVQAVKEGGCKIEVQKDVATILKENGKELSEVGGIIWSHWHFDHVGDVQTFPSTTDIIVGPGFKKAHVPAWPTVPDSHIDEKAWQGRTLSEIDFAAEGKLKIGQFDALDFYGDGSFYILNTPGHTIGHLSALARTTVDPPTFIFMGGDIAHQGGEFRPTPYMPLPAQITPNPFHRKLARPAMACPGDIFVNIHRNKSRTEPFFDPTPVEGAWHYCAHEAKRSIEKLTEFDAYENIFPVIAHDNSLYGIIDVYPKPANDWLARGWKDETRWGWLNEFDPGSEGLAKASEQ